jgi:hypothetical protein
MYAENESIKSVKLFPDDKEAARIMARLYTNARDKLSPSACFCNSYSAYVQTEDFDMTWEVQFVDITTEKWCLVSFSQGKFHPHLFYSKRTALSALKREFATRTANLFDYSYCDCKEKYAYILGATWNTSQSPFDIEWRIFRIDK